MSEWQLRRFWQAATVAADGDGWGVLLDGRGVRTPAGAPLRLPTPALAAAVAAEWQAQDGPVQPASMPLTRLANTAIDKVGPQQAAIADLVAAYGATDLLCHRATAPPELVATQAAAWDPLLDWAAAVLGARLRVTGGVIAIDQPAMALERLRAEVAGLDPFRLGALHDLVAISGSLILGLAVLRRHLTVAVAWEAATVDESWQIAHWGADAEAAAVAVARRADLLAAGQLLELCRPDGPKPGGTDPGGA